MWELDHKEGWEPKNWCYQIVVLEKTLESPLDSKKIKPVNPKENQPWIFIRRTDAGAETLNLWPPDVKNWLIRKDPDAGKDWRQEDKGMTENEMVWWHHWIDGHEFEQILRAGDAICFLLLLPSSFPSIRVFSNESSLNIRWPKYWSFSFSINPSNEYSGLIFFRIDWFELFAVQETLKSLL